MSKKRAFVRYTKAGEVVPGSLILTNGSYPNGPALWEEVPADLCCSTTPVEEIYTMVLRFNIDPEGLGNFIGGDPYVLASWNTFFDLPVYGAEFTSLTFENPTLYETIVTLVGGHDIYVKDGLFYDISILVSVDDSGAVTTIGDASFGYCSSLKTVRFANCTRTIYTEDVDYGSFGSSYNLYSVDMPKLYDLGEGTFYDCEEMTDIILDFNNITYLAPYTFYYNYYVENWSFPNVIYVGDDCFEDCGGALSFNFPSLITAADYAFQNCTDTTIFNMPSLINIGKFTFVNCTNILSFSFPSAVNVNDFGFFFCPNTISFNLPLVTNVGSHAFSNCTSSTTFNLNSIVWIGEEDCSVINGVFNGIIGNTITLTVPTAIMTCDSGFPDADIVGLQSNNTVTVITV